MQINEFTTTEAQKGMRLDSCLSTVLSISRSKINGLIKDSFVLVNDETTKSGYIVKFNDNIKVIQKELETSGLVPENIPLDVVYEDDQLAVINKQQGLVVHPGGGATSNTLANALLYHYPKIKEIDLSSDRPGIVHRLDKDTSGLIVIAKTANAHMFLSKQFADRVVTKTYIAICEGVFKEDTDKITTFIIRDIKDGKRMRVSKSQGKEAITTYKVLEKFANYTYVQFNILTGRTHQIRVHAKHIGHPVVADDKYGFRKQKFTVEGQLLHANFLEFTHPKTNKRVSFTAEPPKDFLRILTLLQEGKV